MEETKVQTTKRKTGKEEVAIKKKVKTNDTPSTVAKVVLPRFNRIWAMPNAKTFEIKPIKALLDRYIPQDSELVVVDPFARDSKYGTYTNDLNPETEATYHMSAIDFLDMLLEQNIVADVVLFDPPYSPRQISECYQSIGLKASMQDTQNGVLYKNCKERLAKLLKVGGIGISFGWNSAGLGKSNGCEIVEILMVPHGGPHNDTIVTVDRKL